MTNDHHTHADHAHAHGERCGHTAVQHGDHVDYLHDGHLHHLHDGHVDEHVLPVDAANPAECRPVSCDHAHAEACGHEVVPHGDHLDYLVDGRLHHVHDGHCDDHGAVAVVG